MGLCHARERFYLLMQTLFSNTIPLLSLSFSQIDSFDLSLPNRNRFHRSYLFLFKYVVLDMIKEQIESFCSLVCYYQLSETPWKLMAAKKRIKKRSQKCFGSFTFCENLFLH